jgi:hypothetical protein
METADSTYNQITFHYINGQTESFKVYSPIEDDQTQVTLQLEVRHLFKKDWWIVNLPEQSVFINLDNVIKVEMKPSMPDLKGDDVFSNAERVTALNRPR